MVEMFSPRDDDVLGPIPELDVAVGVPDAEVAGVEPTTAEGVIGGFGSSK